MNLKVRRWLPIAICCLPGVIAALAIAGTSFGLTLDGPFSGLVVLAILTCPLTMFVVISRRSGDDDVPNESAKIMGCCVSSDYFFAREADRLNALRAERESLDRELAELQASPVGKIQILKGD